MKKKFLNKFFLIQKIPRFSSYLSIRTLPKNYEEAYEVIFSHEFKKIIHASEVIVLKYAIVLSDVIWSPFLVRFFPSFSKKTEESKFSLLMRLKFLSKPGNKLDKAIWISDDWSNNYFHWFVDCIPRLILAEKESKGAKVVLRENLRDFPFIEESLNYLGFETHYFSRNSAVLIKELVIPSHCAPSGNFNKENINEVRTKFVQGDSDPNGIRIYISREKANYRKIKNENELIKLVKEFGYEIHYFEEYDFVQQVKLMGSSNSVISIHGAGLTNILFMKSKSKVLEIRNKNLTSANCYFTLSSDLDLDYYTLLGEPEYEYSVDQLHEINITNITIDINDLEECLKKMHGND